ncbi:MAG: hypothetical protein IAE79_25845, partial [Anaerolinea sp.]|nr:hypothetical protein [Anaerolinea sp.]
VEPGEVAAALRRWAGVVETAVLPQVLPDGETRLLGFVTPADVDVAALRRWAGTQLPGYLVPARLWALATLPRLASDKVDRQRLLALAQDGGEAAGAYAPPRTPLQQTLADIWAEALRVARVGIDDNFFELGGHSLQAAQAAARAAQALARPVTVGLLLARPTVAELAAALTVADDEEPALDEPPPSLAGPYLLLAERPLTPDDVGPVDAAALGYLRQKAWRYDRLLYAQSGGRPILLGATQTAWGRFALIMLPRFAADLYADPPGLVQEVVAALSLAGQMRARTVSLTGLIPSATDYGRALLPALAAHGNLPDISTGHAATTAAVVMAVERVLAESGRDLAQERVGFLGLGSIGAASLRLLLATQPHPQAIILGDLYSKQAQLEALRAEIVTELGFVGEVQLAPSRQEVPAAFYEATLIVGATNVPDILDVARLRPGALLVDDSGPHCFNLEQAVHRFAAAGDILFTEGGVLQLPQPLHRLRYVPPAAPPLGTSLIDDPYEVMGCAFSSLLPRQFPELEATVGLATVAMCVRYYRRLAALGFRAGPLHSKGYRFAATAVARFRQRFGVNREP